MNTVNAPWNFQVFADDVPVDTALRLAERFAEAAGGAYEEDENSIDDMDEHIITAMLIQLYGLGVTGDDLKKDGQLYMHHVFLLK